MLPRTLEPEVMDTVQEAVDYDSMDHSAVNQRFVLDLLQFAEATGSSALQNNSSCALDLGTGTALIPLELLSSSQTPARILACDLSLEMLKLALGHIFKSNRYEQLFAIYCDCKNLPIADQSCDLVMSNSIVHHIPHPLDVFLEMRRVLKPGGLLFVRDLLRPKSEEQVDRLVKLYAGNENAHQRQMFRQSLHAALTVGEVAELLNAADLLPALSNGRSAVVSATSDRHWTVALVAT
jgi:ubiquinone/menaquinone biosynthesis C-methylase UbiE